jgi:hypothetical protein
LCLYERPLGGDGTGGRALVDGGRTLPRARAGNARSVAFAGPFWILSPLSHEITIPTQATALDVYGEVSQPGSSGRLSESERADGKSKHGKQQFEADERSTGVTLWLRLPISPERQLNERDVCDSARALTI